MAGKPKFTKVASPKGIAKFPKLNTPDTKFKAEGEYSVKLLVDKAEAQPLIDKIEAEITKTFDETKAALVKDGKAAKAKGLKMADKPYRDDLDDEGNETGKVSFTFKSKASYVKDEVTHKLNPPSLFDAAGKPITGKRPDVWGGSVLRCSGELIPFATAIGVGCSLRLNAVQIIELRTGGDRSASDFGFEAEEGYTAEDAAPEAAAEDTTDDDGAADTPNF